MTEIKFCENNFSQGTEEIIERLKEETEDVEIQIEPCLGYCGDCAVSPFALVDNELIQADTPEDLYDLILEQL